MTLRCGGNTSRKRRVTSGILGLVVLLVKGSTLAQERPSDEELLGDDEEGTTSEANQSSSNLSRLQNSISSDTLQVGGLLYARGIVTAHRGERAENYGLTAPFLLDTYLDARPNDRLRGFVLGRLLYDPAGINDGTGSSLNAGGYGNGFGQSSTGTIVYGLDQLWLNFDIARTLFVTVGKQHDRWGTGRFWMPTDYLHLQSRDPLAAVDVRTGTSMVKLHLPVENLGWNFYAYALLENPNNALGALGNVAYAGRAQFLVGVTEFSMGAFYLKGDSAKFAGDLSSSIGPVGFYGEVAAVNPRLSDRVRFDPAAIIPAAPVPPTWQTPDETLVARVQQVVDARFPTYQTTHYVPQIVGGLYYTGMYNTTDKFTVGGEYFYNGLGYDDSLNYLGLVMPHTVALRNPARAFYYGRHYAGAYIAFPAQFSWDLHSFSLSTLANISDHSVMTRFDYGLIILTNMTFDAFTSVRYGNESGEFRQGLPPTQLAEFTFSQTPIIFDVGVGLRISY